MQLAKIRREVRFWCSVLGIARRLKHVAPAMSLSTLTSRRRIGATYADVALQTAARALVVAEPCFSRVRRNPRQD